MSSIEDAGIAEHAGAEGGSVETTRPRPRAGRIVLIAGVILAVSSIILSVIVGVVGAPYVDRAGGGFQFNFQFGDPRPTVSALGLVAPLHAVLGGLVGTWIIIQSIVAIAADWGRKEGIVALIIAVVTPIISFIIFLALLLSLG
ncbi:MAG: hypothetical protein RL499_166 [Actinomycetota bacterium]|jgi:hypothetical protein